MHATRADVVLVLAATFVAEHGPEDIDPLIEANIRLAATIMEAARLEGVRRFMMAGTFWEERSTDDPEAVDLYAATRRAAKEILRYYVAAYGWEAAHVRVCDLYGPSDPRPKLFHHLRQAVVSGKSLPMSPGEQVLELLHVSDAARGFRAVVEDLVGSEGSGLRDYGLFSAAPMRLRDVVAAYESVIGRTVPVEWGGRPYRFREVMSPVRQPGPPKWAPRIVLLEGLREMERAPGGVLTL